MWSVAVIATISASLAVYFGGGTGGGAVVNQPAEYTASATNAPAITIAIGVLICERSGVFCLSPSIKC